MQCVFLILVLISIGFKSLYGKEIRKKINKEKAHKHAI